LLLIALEGFSEPEAAHILNVDVTVLRELVAQGHSELAAQAGADILIVSTEPLMTLDLEQIFAGAGHRVVGEAHKAADAMRLAEAKRPDLVIIANMRLADDGDGLELARELLQRAALAVVILTAYPQRFLTGERPEPAFVIGKPYQPAAIAAVAAQALLFAGRRSMAASGW
jgi:DNA-binding NarL/FixJ family response regulator